MLFNKYFYKTVYDVGFFRSIGRLKHEIKKIIYTFLPGDLNLFISNGLCKIPNFKKVLLNLKNDNIYIEKNNLNVKFFRFNFLNDEKLLTLPIDWNSAKFNRLWKFNLHYFDWAREVLDYSDNQEFSDEKLLYLEFIIEDWIENNIPGYGDGWNSYTISLRIRNWILIFRTLPNLLNEKFLSSLWHQLCWLFNNKEIYLGGNHWIENLVSLIIGSMQFEGSKAKNMYKYSMRKLELELKNQILSDGGHIERSASYHLLILDRLVELGLIIENIKGERPIWLIEAISKMTKWSLAIKLKNGEYPKFNDNLDLNFSIDSIINYANCYLEQKIIKEKSIKNKLSRIYKNNKISKENFIEKNQKKSLTKLLDTGWIIANINQNIELIFKVGKSCPKWLPAHAHSDLLSFELFCKGVPLIVETGTSNYGDNKKRHFERSGQAHNILQLAPFKKNKKGLINWIESIEVWGNFRAARKAKILEKVGTILKDGTIFMKGSNNANHPYGAKHTRIIKLKEKDEKDVLLEIIDEVRCSKKMYWRQFWHLGPEQSTDFLMPLISELRKQYIFEANFVDSWVAKKFGKIESRKMLQISGIIEPGTHIFSHKLVIKN